MSPGLHFCLAILASLMRGRFRLSDGHLPSAGHRIGDAIAGVGVAAAIDPAVDELIIEQLAWAGIRHVRLDLTQADEGGSAERLLGKLLAAGVEVTLHLMQVPAEARLMPDVDAERRWQAFVCRSLDRYGTQVEMIELGSTVNRRRWCGHSLAGFLSMWQIGWREVRARGLQLSGPSVTDFEPVWNAGLLSLLKDRGQLPDFHTDNLFSERCTEPERFDHKILGRRLTGWHKFNLIKKARLLARIGADFNVPRLISPAAFWTLPRIERVLPDSEQKQADYLARYMVLCAASGALERAWWGPLICHREGLIDNGKRPYPSLERITRYEHVEGVLADMRVRPALHALRGFIAMIPGAGYEGRMNDSIGLEVHVFRSDRHLVHVVWTENGRAAALTDLYEAADLAAAGFRSRDGAMEDAESGRLLLVNESPRYLIWPSAARVRLKVGAKVLPGAALAVHGDSGRKPFLFQYGAWRGIIHAATHEEFLRMSAAIHPDLLRAPDRKSALRHARNAIWRINDPRGDASLLVVKQPVRVPFYRRILDRNKPAKGLRSWSGACELLRIGVDTPAPVAYFECAGDRSRTRNFYICEYAPGDQSIREVFSALNRGDPGYIGIPGEIILDGLARYILRMHNGGVFFRDMSGGNILVEAGASGGMHFSLIDTGRIRTYPQGVPLRQRLADLSRVCNKLDPDGRRMLLDMYFSAMGKSFSWYMHIPFALYDFKVWLKRKIGRKAIKRVVERMGLGGGKR